MANAFTYQVLKDTTERSVIKITATFDGSGQESNTARIQANTLSGALANNGFLVANNQGGSANTPLIYYDLQVIRMNYNVNFGSTGYLQLFWAGNGGGANNGIIANLSFAGEYGDAQDPSFPNNSVGGKGDIGVATVGAAANGSYTLVIELRKNNAMYQRGQFNDAAAFNFGPFGIKP